ncbi:MAG TPA: hypothetical protein VGF00_07050, partial [Acidimicrobiia bacterium]
MVAGLGPIPSAGIPATAVMAAGLLLNRRPRPRDHARPGSVDPCLLVTAGVGVLALTGAGIGTGLASAGLGAYPLLIIGLLRLQSARL